MRTLVYGMQSSGASLFTYWLSQQNDCIGIIDLYHNQIAPFINYKNVIIKCTITTNISLESHIKQFKPDEVVLFVRNPIENYLSLYEKSYADNGGGIEEKLQILNQCLEKENFNNIVKYEDFIMQKNLGVGDLSYYNFNKKLEQIIEYNNINSEWCKINYRKKWGIGNIHANNLNIFNIKNLSKLNSMYM